MFPEIIAHRGAKNHAPENSLRAIRIAWRIGVSVEIDVRLTKDKKIVVMHDATTRRMCVGASRCIHGQTLGQLKGRRLRKSKKGRPQEKVPTLDEVLKILPYEKNRLVIEIKCGPEVIPFLLDTLYNKIPDRLDQIAILSFQLPLLQTIGENAPELCLYLGGRDPNPSIVGIDGFFCPAVSPELVNRIHENKKKVFVWTVNSMQVADELLKLGVDGIVTDSPDGLKNWLKRKTLSL
jgi:glycerophosphoryl diester phosphodiesterase